MTASAVLRLMLSSAFRLTAIAVAVLLYGFAPGAAEAQDPGGVQTFAVDVPDQTPPLRTVKLTVTLRPMTSSVEFTLTSPHGATRTLDPVSPGSTPPPYTIGSGSTQDRILLEAPAAGADAPDDRIYVISLRLDSDYDDEGGNCDTSTMSGDEQWVVEADGDKIQSVQVESMPSIFAAGGGCADGTPLPASDPDRATVTEPAVDACVEGDGPRPPIHAVLVLDVSGSMGNTVTGIAGAEEKIVALQQATRDFVDVWSQIRSAEATSCPSVPDDQLGVVLFRSSASWWGPLGSGLHDFSVASSTINSTIGSLSASGSTALGQGLQLADGALPAPSSSAPNPPRRVVLYLSNGIQNVRPYAKEQSGSIVLEESSGATSTLTNLGADEASVYAVTVGTDAVTNPDVNQTIARGGGGDYINSEVNATILRPFFLEVLQETLAFATAQTALIESGSVGRAASYTTQVGLNTTSRFASFNLAWPRRQAVLRMRVTAPGGGPTFEGRGEGTIRIPVSFPLEEAPVTDQPWTVEVEMIDPIGNVQSVPVELSVFADDAAVKAEFDVDKTRYAPGDDVTVFARVTEYGMPIEALRLEGTVKARLARPGTPIGDLLARRDASTEAPSQGDVLSATEAELYNLLQEEPDLLQPTVETIEMRDDGVGADQTADDGTYTGQFTAETYGHTNILFNVQGPSDGAGLTRRQRLESVYVRAVPDEAETDVQAATQSTPNGPVLRLTLTPRVSSGALVGPGWNYYYVLQTDAGQTIHPEDNGDGTYVADISYTGSVPTVDLHYLNVASIIDASTEVLPELNEATQFLPSVEEGKPRGSAPNGGIICSELGLGATVVLLFGVGVIGLGIRRRRDTPSNA